MKDHRDGLLGSSRSVLSHFRLPLNGQDIITWPKLKEAGKWRLPAQKQEMGLNSIQAGSVCHRYTQPGSGILVVFVNLAAIHTS